MEKGYYGEVPKTSFIGFAHDGVAYVGLSKSEYESLENKKLFKEKTEQFIIEYDDKKFKLEESTSDFLNKQPYELMVNLLEAGEKEGVIERPIYMINSQNDELVEIN